MVGPSSSSNGSKSPFLGGEEAQELLIAALRRFADKLTYQDLLQLVVHTRRKNDHHPAQFVVACPDYVVRNMTGKPEQRSTYLIIEIPRDVVDRLESKLVLPGER